MKAAVRGLYAVTPDIADTAELAAKVEAALVGGAALVQYRNKTADPELRLVQAGTLRALCQARGVPLVINDDVDVATALDADGLHLGKEDSMLSEARARLGPEKLLGASCYDRLEDAVAAVRAGADYVAFGSFFASVVKPGAVRAPLTLLREARQGLGVPTVAIGGITLDNASQLIAAGADAVAVISALFSASDIRVAAERFNELFKTTLRT
ncbi:MAG: thiamine phosphate synthase [Betaproteobacteria bacterium]|nr:thiamine phosphate synthase [Betaproteobacteria bacterium]MDH3437151.1 thiamine phosphate synthase [Betaproteobacteria bacterium]